MEVRHMNFRLDKGFETIRNHVAKRAAVVSTPSVIAEIMQSMQSNAAAQFRFCAIFDLKPVRNSFNTLTRKCKYFPFKIRIVGTDMLGLQR